MSDGVTPIADARDAKKKAPSMRDLLEELVSKEGSDLHLTVGQLPKLRIDGVLRDSETARQEAKASFAAWTARSTSSTDAKSTSPVCMPAAGL